MSTRITALNLNASGNAQTWKARAPTLEDVFREHFQLIYRTALHVTGNTYNTDDVVQNTFLELIRSNQPLHLLRNPAGYFRRAAAHQALKIVRSRKRVDLTADDERLEEAAPKETSPSSGNKEQQLLGLIETLKPAAALMMKLRYLEGLSNADIAQMLGKSEPVVAVTLFRLRQRLKKIVKGEL